MRVAVVQGTRPEIVKNYSVVGALRAAGVPFAVFHTNQHHRADMCDDFYAAMDYRPDHTFPTAYRLGGVVDWLHDALVAGGYDQVVVNGDTAASLAGGLAAMYADVPLAHIEAGLRSRDRFMLEERNRIMVDHIATDLFAYTAYEVDVLARSEDLRGRVHLLGNTTVDLLHDFADRLVPPADATPYLLVTLHRKELTDHPERMRSAFAALSRLAEDHRVVFPVHPRTADACRRHGLGSLLRGVELVAPVGIFASLALQRYAAAVLTDSGCVQEEAYLLGTPCVTVRENTERHLTVAYGANVLTGFDTEAIVAAARAAAVAPRGGWPDIYGAPGVAGRIVDVLLAGPAEEPALDLVPAAVPA